MFDIQNEFRKLFKIKLEEIVKRNPSVSQRAFGKMLGLSASEISLFMNGKRELGLEKIESALTHLKLTDKEKRLVNMMLKSQPSQNLFNIDESYEVLSDFNFSPFLIGIILQFYPY